MGEPSLAMEFALELAAGDLPMERLGEDDVGTKRGFDECPDIVLPAVLSPTPYSCRALSRLYVHLIYDKLWGHESTESGAFKLFVTWSADSKRAMHCEALKSIF